MLRVPFQHYPPPNFKVAQTMLPFITDLGVVYTGTNFEVAAGVLESQSGTDFSMTNTVKFTATTLSFCYLLLRQHHVLHLLLTNPFSPLTSPSMLSRVRKAWLNLQPPVVTRTMSLSRPRPSPYPLPKEDQREFEDLVRKAQSTPVDPTAVHHPDARTTVTSGFEGEVNPETGEKGGPKREPVRKWGDEGDWSFNGRVSDF